MTRIISENQYNATMARINELLLLVDEETPENNINSVELVLLSQLVEDYEKEHYPISKPSLIEILRLRMYEMKLSQKAMAQLIGISPSRFNEILTGKREPTFQVARSICINLSIDANLVLNV